MPETAIFDHYEVLTRDDGSLFELGRGAMGITYKAFDTSLRIPVALKVINSTYLNSEVARQRFVREARSAAQLRHRNVASVFHLGTEGETWFYAMEFIDGETLDSLIKRQGPLYSISALNIAGQVARALNAAAQHGLVHRDIKPSNLMLVKEDDEIVAKVIDFGLAKAQVGSEEDAVTLSMGGFVGTPHFASPEQLEEREIDSRSDIYSLGVTLWYMLAGQAPFAGSMAQVMSQHLTKPPPFEKLEHIHAPVAEVLRKMLAKDPADRYQTPAEVRKAIEAALEQISRSEATAPATSLSSTGPAPVETHEDFATLINDATLHAGLGSFETNTTIANRYRVAQSCGETNVGKVFRAYDTQRKSEVRLVALHPEALGDTAALTALEHEVERLKTVNHPNLIGVYDFETVDRGSFLVLEWTEGFSLLDLLKARRELDADEVLKLLQQAAAGVDHAVAQGLTGLEFGLHQIQIHFPEPIEKETLLRTPLANWPAFTLKLYPLGSTRDFSASQTWAGGQTVVGGATPCAQPDAECRPQYVQALASVVYELLGGSLSPLALRGGGGPTRYTPLATLSEEGNEVLRSALDPARSFPSASDFATALARLDGLQIRRHDSKHPIAARSPVPAVVPIRPSTTQPPPVVPPSGPQPIHPRPEKKVPVLLFTIVILVFLGIIGGVLFLSAPLWKTAGTGTPAPVTPAPASETPAPTEPSHENTPTVVDNTPVATPIPATPIPVTPIAITPIPGPSRQDQLKSAVTAAQELEEKNDWPKALDAWLAITKEYPESLAGRTYLEPFLNHLRDRPAPISFQEFQGMRDQITESAQLGILSAMLLLGDNLRKTEPESALHWFSTAAEKGDPTAHVQYGLMLKKGQGIANPDPVKAVAEFQAAADQGDMAGKFELGECYLNGQGVAADPKHGVELLREAADGGDSRAMSELGYCYTHALGVPVNYATAFELFSKASEKGNLDAMANLGVLYVKGQGVQKSPTKAAELFEKGARAGNPVCMWMYGACLSEGVGTPRNLLQATTWYRKAANAGNPAAIEWCRQNKVPYTSDN
jgi:serine/threonine protein kinase/TPR repeat protein